MDDFKDFISRKQSLVSEFVRQYAVKRRRQRDLDSRMQTTIEMLLDDYFFHTGLPKTPENMARAMGDVTEFIARKAQEAREETPDF